MDIAQRNFLCDQDVIAILQLKEIGRVGCNNNLAHDVAVPERAFAIDGKIANERGHGSQSLWMDAVLRFLDAKQTTSLRILGQYGERKKSQGPVRYGTGRKLLAAGLGNRQGEQFANIVAHHIDARDGNQFRQSCRYTCGNVVVPGRAHSYQSVER